MQRYVIEVVICTSYVSVDSDSCDLNFIEVDAETEVSWALVMSSSSLISFWAIIEIEMGT